MEKTDNEKLKRYNELFSSNEEKAEAFDKIAEQYYDKNFGKLSKTDFETLIFHLYLEQILKKDDQNFSAYSDYKLSKELGITQSKVSNLKVRKQLQYPRKEFKWQKSFANICKNAHYENKRIILQIPDINLFNEIKNAIEEIGGYVDITLTSNLLKVSPEYFIDVLLAALEEKDRKKLRKTITKEIKNSKNYEDIDYIENGPIGMKIANCGLKFVIDVLKNSKSSVTGTALVAIENIISALN